MLHYRQTFHFDPSDANAAAVLASAHDLAKKEIVRHGERVAAGSGMGTTGEIDGSAGYKAVQPVASGASTVLDASGALTLHGGAGSIIALAFAPMNHVGGNGADTIAAFGVDSALTATGGSGTGLFLAGASGHNSITGGSGRSIIFGGGEGDVLTAVTGAGDTIKAGTGVETISAAGTQGVHKLYAGSGPNLIRTGNNNTTVLLSTGAATISAGTGMDLYAIIPSALDVDRGRMDQHQGRLV